MTVCPKCQHTHVARDVVPALSRFIPVFGGYRTPDGQIHATREAAQEQLCEQRQAEEPAT